MTHVKILIETLSFNKTLHQSSLSEDSSERTSSTSRHSIDKSITSMPSMDNLSNTLNLSEITTFNSTFLLDPLINSITISMCPNPNLRPSNYTIELTKSMSNLDFKVMNDSVIIFKF